MRDFLFPGSCGILEKDHVKLHNFPFAADIHSTSFKRLFWKINANNVENLSKAAN